jgi:hypothetical protein
MKALHACRCYPRRSHGMASGTPLNGHGAAPTTQPSTINKWTKISCKQSRPMLDFA